MLRAGLAPDITVDRSRSLSVGLTYSHHRLYPAPSSSPRRQRSKQEKTSDKVLGREWQRLDQNTYVLASDLAFFSSTTPHFAQWGGVAHIEFVPLRLVSESASIVSEQKSQELGLWVVEFRLISGLLVLYFGEWREV